MNEWGRIFFINDEKGSLDAIYAQPLSNHTENCLSLLNHFSPSFFHKETKERLFTAVELHDAGKVETFRITTDETRSTSGSSAGSATGRAQRSLSKNKLKPQVLFDKSGNGDNLRYSFAGHRFRIKTDDTYIAALIRAHHEYSVEEINRTRALLDPEEKVFFPDDLYLLCMADQLEAELAVKTVEKKDDIPRTFMEFTSERMDDSFRVFTVIPWPFCVDEIKIPIKLFELPEDMHSHKSAKAIEKNLKERSLPEKPDISITLKG